MLKYRLEKMERLAEEQQKVIENLKAFRPVSGERAPAAFEDDGEWEKV